MRLSIHDFSQQVAAGMVDTVTVKGKEKTISIDATDLLILDWFTKFYPNMSKKIIDGKEYGWIKRSKVIEDLPILRISEDSVSDRLRKLVHFKLLDYKLVKDGGTFCYYTHGERYPELINIFCTDGTGSTRHPVPGQPGTPVPGQPGYKDSNKVLDNSYIKNNGRFKSKSSKPTDHATSNDAKLCPQCGQSHLYRNRQMGRWECGNCFYNEQ